LGEFLIVGGRSNNYAELRGIAELENYSYQNQCGVTLFVKMLYSTKKTVPVFHPFPGRIWWCRKISSFYKDVKRLITVWNQILAEGTTEVKPTAEI
jgi:hypothetical protein